MLKRNSIRILAFSVIILIQSCSKDDEPAPNQPSIAKLIRVDWTPGTAKEEYHYSADNSLKRIVYSIGQTSTSYEFTWNNNKVTEVYDPSSSYKHFYFYNGDKLSYTTRSQKNDASQIVYKMEYTYRQDGKADKLKYFTVEENGTELKAGSTYYYNAAGELSHTVTIMENYTITHTIEGYSQEVKFIPWGFIDLTLMEDYMIFNYPVLSTMKGFPVKITRKVKIGDTPEFVDTITTHTCEISNGRINKMTVDFKVPSHPELDKTRNAFFNYNP